MKWDNSKRLQMAFIISINEVSAAKYYEMLECLPPQAMVSNAFLVGEPTDHEPKTGLPRYDLYFTKDKKFYYGGVVSEPDFKLWLIPCEADEINDEGLQDAAAKLEYLEERLRKSEAGESNENQDILRNDIKSLIQ